KALTPVAGRPLIDYALDGFVAAGISQVMCIVNEAAPDVPRYGQSYRKTPTVDWIIQTTPSSMHSFLIVLERLAKREAGPFLMTTVGSVCASPGCAPVLPGAQLFPNADIVLGLADVIDDEKPLRVAMRGNENTGL